MTNKTERLVNLIALLLDSERPLTLDEIVELVPGYDAKGESLRRMFERDKDELRQLGVPVELIPRDAWGTAERYAVDADAYAMPDLKLEADERAALALAARVWAGGLGAGNPAVTKLDLDPSEPGQPLHADLEGGSPLVGALLDALHDRRRVTFDYQPAGRDVTTRRLEPYALVHRRGAWYVVGRDVDRDARRSFRLSRICSDVRLLRPNAHGREYEVPDGFVPGDIVPSAGDRDGQPATAVVRATEPAARLAELRGGEPLGTGLDGRRDVRVPVGDSAALLAWALTNEIAILGPADLRDEMADRLGRLADRLATPEPAAVQAAADELLAVGGETTSNTAPRRARRGTPASERIQRLLALVPWVLAHPEATVTEVCERFGVDRRTLVADLDLLFVSGLPPYGPGDLIEAWVDDEHVHVRLAGYFARTPRLTWREVVGMYLAGRALASVPGLSGGALQRALDRLEAALPAGQLSGIHDLASRVQVDLDGDDVERRHLPVLARAAEERHQVDLEYYTGARGELTRRTIDPWVLFPSGGHWYLTAYCHRAGEERRFRVDRILRATPTGQRFALPAGFDPLSGSLSRSFDPDEGVDCVVALDPDAEWLQRTLPVLGSARLPDGRLAVRFVARELTWATRLVLRLAPHGVPVAPPELRAASAAAARRLRAAQQPD